MKISHDKPSTDHLGNVFGNIKSMCAFWNIRPETFSRRITVYKMSLEDALTRPVKHNGGIKCKDHLGQKFFSQAEMCQYWGIDHKLYEYRISHGWSQEDSLTKPSRQISTKKKPAE